MAELAWLPCLANSIRSLCIRISDRSGDSPTCRGDDVLNNEAGLSTQGGQYQKSEIYLQTLACSLHDRALKPLLPYLTFGTAQMRSKTVRSRVEQLSHLQGIAATCQPRVIQAGPRRPHWFYCPETMGDRCSLSVKPELSTAQFLPGAHRDIAE